MRFFFFKTNDRLSETSLQNNRPSERRNWRLCEQISIQPWSLRLCCDRHFKVLWHPRFTTRDSCRENGLGVPPPPPHSSVWCNQPILCNKYNIALRHLPRVLLGPLLFCTIIFITGQKRKQRREEGGRGVWAGMGEGRGGELLKVQDGNIVLLMRTMFYFHNHPYQQVVHPDKR